MSGLAHRAPEGVRDVRGAHFALGLCCPCGQARLEDEAGLSMSPDAAVALVMDGRLDNRELLTALLRQHRFELWSHSDGALALAAYMKFGEDFLTKLDGDFAIVIWDGRTRNAILAVTVLALNRCFIMSTATAELCIRGKAILTLSWVRTRFNACTALRMMSGREPGVVRDALVGNRAGSGAEWLGFSAQQKRAGCYWDPAALAPGPRRSAKDHVSSTARFSRMPSAVSRAAIIRLPWKRAADSIPRRSPQSCMTSFVRADCRAPA